VELEATISADGKVKNPRVVHGNSMLQRSAIDAVLQWRYQPAMLNGKPVESPVEIKLNFVASR
jgi:TonB family protein